MSQPLDHREGLEFTPPEESALARDLGKLAEKHGLTGCVMLSLKGERVGVNSSGKTDKFCAVMTRVGDQILADFDDGRYDAALGEFAS